MMFKKSLSFKIKDSQFEFSFIFLLGFLSWYGFHGFLRGRLVLSWQYESHSQLEILPPHLDKQLVSNLTKSRRKPKKIEEVDWSSFLVF